MLWQHTGAQEQAGTPLADVGSPVLPLSAADLGFFSRVIESSSLLKAAFLKIIAVEVNPIVEAQCFIDMHIFYSPSIPSAVM